MPPIEQDVLSVTIIGLIILAIIARSKKQSMMDTLKELIEDIKGGEDG